MTHQVFRYNDDEHGSYAPGWPRGPLTDDYLKERAIATGKSVDEVMEEAASFRTPGGHLYTLTAQGRKDLTGKQAKRLDAAAEAQPEPDPTPSGEASPGGESDEEPSPPRRGG